MNLSIAAALSCSVLTVLALGSPARPAPKHLEDARQLVKDLSNDAKVNEYGTRPTFLKWERPTREARTVCATFVTRLFEHSYGFTSDDIEKWLHANGADAVDWYNAVVTQRGFRHITNVHDIALGDVLAIKYSDSSKDTGHVMLVDHKPEAIGSEKPVISGTAQMKIQVIDSSASGHGPNDTRSLSGGGFTGGIGRGTFRLYINADGLIVGYAWGQSAKSKFYEAPARDLVVGRLTRTH